MTDQQLADTDDNEDFIAAVMPNGDRGKHHEQAPRNPADLDRVLAEDLIAPYVEPSAVWWRNCIYKLSRRRINLGESPDERYVRDLRSTISTHLRNPYVLVYLSGKGGVGKTTIVTVTGSIFKQNRLDRAVAADLDPSTSANLASRIDSTGSDGRTIGADNKIERASHLRHRTGQNKVGLEVVASPHHANANASAMSAAEFDALHAKLTKWYEGLILVDCGNDLEHPAMPAVLKHANAVVMVASAAPDGGAGALRNLQWLADNGSGHLLSRTTVVINHDKPFYSRKDRRAKTALVTTLQEHFARLVSRDRIHIMPFDPHVDDGGVIDITRLNPNTYRSALETCAAIATGFEAS